MQEDVVERGRTDGHGRHAELGEGQRADPVDQLLAWLGADDRDAGAALDDVTGLAVERGEQPGGVVIVGEGEVGDLAAEPIDQL